MIHEQNQHLKIRNLISARFLLFVLFLLLLVFLLPLSALAPWFIVLLGFILAISIISCLSEKEDRIFLLRVFIFSFLLRIFVAFLLYLYSLGKQHSEGFFIADGGTFSVAGWRIASLWRDGISLDTAYIKSLSISGAIHPYDFINAAVYFIFGKSPLTMLFLNCFLGSFVLIFMYFITLCIFNREISKKAVILCAFWPSLFLWSTQNLKEPLTIFLVVLCFWGLIFFIKRFNLMYLAVTIVSLFLLKGFRGPVAKIIAASIILHFFFLGFRQIKREPFLILIAVLLISAAGYFIFNQFGDAIFKFFDPLEMGKVTVSDSMQQIQHMRSARASSRLAILPDYDISSPVALLKYLPLGLLAVLLAPFPWQLFSSSQILAVPEMLIWYIMIPCVVRGLIFAAKEKSEYLFSIFVYICGILLMLSVFEGNIGTMFRHRIIAVMFLLIFMAVGIQRSKGLLKISDKKLTIF